MLVRKARAAALDGVDPVDERGASGVLAPSWTARVAAKLRVRALDRALIDGADPAESPQLAAHSARLTRRSTRWGVADGLDRMAHTGVEPARVWGILPSRNAVRANLQELHDLAAVLRGPSPVYAQGVAMLRVLVSDGTGPAYTDRDGSALGARLRRAHRAMSG